MPVAARPKRIGAPPKKQKGADIVGARHAFDVLTVLRTRGS